MKKSIVLLLVIVIILCSCAAPTPTEPTTITPIKLTINSANIISMGPLFVADAEGFFAEQNIEVEFINFNRSPEALPLLANGDINVYTGSLDTGLINTIGSADNIAIVADKGNLDKGDCSYFGIALRKDLIDSGEITKPADLKGEPILASQSGLTAYVLDRLLEKDGLNLDDVVISEVPRNATVEAFTNKSIVAGVLPDPYLTQAINSGEAILWYGAEDIIEGFQAAIVAFGPLLIKDNPEAGVRFMVAYLKGVKQYNEGKTDRNVEILIDYTGLPEQDIVTACWPPIRENGNVDFTTLDDFQKWNIDKGFLELPILEERLLNQTFAEQAFAKLNP